MFACFVTRQSTTGDAYPQVIRGSLQLVSATICFGSNRQVVRGKYCTELAAHTILPVLCSMAPHSFTRYQDLRDREAQMVHFHLTDTISLSDLKFELRFISLQLDPVHTNSTTQVTGLRSLSLSHMQSRHRNFSKQDRQRTGPRLLHMPI
jgi:hypothetical protein